MQNSNKIIPAYWLVKNSFDWNSLAHLAKTINYSPNQMIICSGAALDNFYYLHKGQAKCVYYSKDGQEKIFYHIGEGAMFAEAPTIANNYPTGNYIAIEKCTIYKFPRELVLGKLIENKDIAYDLLLSLSYRICMLSQHIQGLTILDIDKYVCRSLYWLLRRKGENTTFINPQITQQEMANLLGVHRTTLARTLNKLKKKGVLLKFTKTQLEISCLEKLKSEGEF